MNSVLVYGVGSALGGLLLGLAWLAFYGGASNADRPTGAILVRFLILGMVGPYVWTEGLTKIVGAPLNPLISQAWVAAKAPGELQYYRVITYTGERARVYAVGRDVDESGFSDQPVLSVILQREGQEWKVVDTDLLSSTRQAKYALVIPPYH